jgi:hypothetical protein
METVCCALWREIDVSVRTQGSRSYPKHVLFLDPFDESLWYLVIILGHGNYIQTVASPVKSLRELPYRSLKLGVTLPVAKF